MGGRRGKKGEARTGGGEGKPRIRPDMGVWHKEIVYRSTRRRARNVDTYTAFRTKASAERI